ncbi:hypothetical protein [Nocardia asiatica]|uniref:hypothetical protein n=1 Tax=Nocardia asiatica TaxID=209252 RepID=UPI0024589CBA|nr:hypothetical protein [Nocardia asiatica]
MPDEYDRIRDPYDNPARGRIFENGIEHLFRERRNGYVNQPDRYVASLGYRHYDKARADEQGRIHAIEDKSGQIGSKNDIRELQKDRELLAERKIESLRIRTVAGEQMSPKYQKLLTELKREFGDRVIHQELTREQAREAFAKGLGREKNARQLELKTRHELNRANRARQRLAKLRKIVRVQERAEKFRKMQQFREAAARGRADASQQAERDRQAREQAERARQALRTSETERARVEREAAERVARIPGARPVLAAGGRRCWGTSGPRRGRCCPRRACRSRGTRGCREGTGGYLAGSEQGAERGIQGVGRKGASVGGGKTVVVGAGTAPASGSAAAARSCPGC